MAKSKTAYVCSACGYDSPKWLGKCPSCSAWSTFQEIRVDAHTKHTPSLQSKQTSPIQMASVPYEKTKSRLMFGMEELDRVLGGGLTVGALTLLGGDPGIGKSTLLLQLSNMAALRSQKVLYVSGEESIGQLKARADRLTVQSDELYVLAETDLLYILECAQQQKPDILIIDSIQTVYLPTVDASPGSVSQVRECTSTLMRFCKREGISTFMIGHVTKDGSIAGPKMLEHMVDTVLYFEGEKYDRIRFLRTVKNRFGGTHEIGIFDMTESGLHEIKNPSSIFVEGSDIEASGSAIIPCYEGSRVVLVELQALATPTNFGNPRRVAIGIDVNRLNLLVAVMEKGMQTPMQYNDVYCKLVGGMRLNEPALDVGMIASIYSSVHEKPLSKRTVFLGEVGLSGEVRRIPHVKERVKELVKLGYEKVYLPYKNKEDVHDIKGIEIQTLKTLEELKNYIK